MTRVRVDTDLCSANAVCVGLVPRVFELDGDDLHILKDPLDPADLSAVTEAVDSCPTGALHLEEQGPTPLVTDAVGTLSPRLDTAAGMTAGSDMARPPVTRAPALTSSATLVP